MPSPRAVRLLIADDDPNALRAYELFFGAHGYETRTKEDGADALAEYCVWCPDAVVRRSDARFGRARGGKGDTAPTIRAGPLAGSDYCFDITYRAGRINQRRVRSSFCKACRSACCPRCNSGPPRFWRHGWFMTIDSAVRAASGAQMTGRSWPVSASWGGASRVRCWRSGSRWCCASPRRESAGFLRPVRLYASSVG